MATEIKAPTDGVAQASLGQREFKRVAEFIRGELGIQLPPAKHTMVESRLRRAMRRTPATNFKDYVDRVLASDADPVERQDFLDQITTNKTELFREADHFDHLIDVALPAVIGDRMRPTLNIWSSACSSGEEPYTLSMVLLEAKRQADDFDFRILASDISREILEQAARATYPIAHADDVPAGLRSRYLLRSKDGRQIRMSNEVRRRVTFGQLNLMLPPYKVTKDLDVVFCRNVLIYFDRPTQLRVVDGLVNCLRPGGYLYLGHSESAQGAGPKVDRVGNAVYRKKF